MTFTRVSYRKRFAGGMPRSITFACAQKVRDSDVNKANSVKAKAKQYKAKAKAKA